MFIQPPAPAVELVLRGQDTAVGYACPKCGQLFLLSKEDVADEKRAAEVAERARQHCCHTCLCGQPVSRPYWLRCDPCIVKEEIKKEKARIERAEKVSIEDYPDQPVFWGSKGQDGYFENVSALLDYCEDYECEIPETVWAAKPTHLRFDVTRLLEGTSELQNLHDGALDGVTQEAKKVLQEFLDVWAEEQNVCSWHQDMGRVVVLRPFDS